MSEENWKYRVRLNKNRSEMRKQKTAGYECTLLNPLRDSGWVDLVRVWQQL